MKCGYQTFGRAPNRSKRTSQAENVDKLIALFKRSDIYPLDDTKSRDFDDNFFWRHVEIPKASGTNKDKNKESAKISEGMRGLFNVVCVPEDVRNDFTEFEEDDGPNDDEVNSVVSSVAGRDEAVQDEVDRSDEEDEEGDTDKKVQTTLKRIGNVQRKKRSPLLFKELLGDDGDDAMHGLKEKHLKSLATTKSRIDTVKIVNKHFEAKLQRRMTSLTAVTEKSLNKTFTRRNRPWKSKSREYIVEKRRNNNS
eukprot:scaffold31518_cov56-Cyclotella_meneghiniana.AAC.3